MNDTQTPKNIGDELLDVLRSKVNDNHYYNPHFLSEIVTHIYDYYDVEDEQVDKWIEKMWSA